MRADELGALAALLNAIRALQTGDMRASEENCKVAERRIMAALGMVEIEGVWRMPITNESQGGAANS